MLTPTRCDMCFNEFDGDESLQEATGAVLCPDCEEDKLFMDEMI